MQFEVGWPDTTWVRAIMVLSLNGSPVGQDGSGRSLSGPSDRALFLRQRRQCDAILVGATTASTNDYGALKFDPEVQAARLARGQKPVPDLFVVSRSSSFAERSTSTPRIVRERQPHTFVRPEIAHLAQLIQHLRLRGENRILCEGGPTLLSTLIAADLIDDLLMTYRLQLLDGSEWSAPGALSEIGRFAPTSSAAHSRRLTLKQHQLIGDELMTHWVRNENAGC